MGVVWVVIAVVVIGLVIGLFIAKKRKWNLSITINKDEFSQWDTIEWNLHLNAKKEIQWNNLNIKLVCSEESSSYDGDGNTRTQKRVIYKTEKKLEDKTNYLAWTQKDFKFSLLVPDMTEYALKSGLWKILSTVGKVFWNRKKIIRMIEARLDAKGLDLTTNEEITVTDFF